tara:strand:- start:426 stop:626 length:201 start_codon:yes stop_codon:yes gene_type:complete
MSNTNYNSTWSIDDVDMILGDYNLSPLSTNQKKECVEELVTLLSEEIGMEYLRAIVERMIDVVENK